MYAQVGVIDAQLERKVQAWDGARVQLAATGRALRANEAALRVARANLRMARVRIARRLVQLYVSPNPDTLDVIVGAKSISDLIDRIEAAHVIADQDSAIARQAEHFQREVARHERLLRVEQHARARTFARLSEERQTIVQTLARERRLLATIHQTIGKLEADQAARQRRLAALAQARIAQQVAVAKRRAAAAAVSRAAPPALETPSDAAPPTPSPPPAASSPSPTPPASPAPPAAPAPSTPVPAPPPAPAPPLVNPSPAPSTHADAASIAARYLGVPYVWGGASPAGFDCSGLVSYVYGQLGLSLPHYTVAQWNATTSISTADLSPGDLVFFDGLSHVGIYVGDGRFIHAPHTGTVVQISSLSGYWVAHLDGARRVP